MTTTWTNPSSSGGKDYTTILADDGKLLCNCKGWTMRRGDKPRHCKHTQKAVADLGAAVVTRGEFVFLTTAALEAAAKPPAKRFSKADVTVAATTRLNPAGVGPRSDGTHVVADVPPPAPMLASAMTTPVTGRDFDRAYPAAEWAMEEKLDGHRCVAVVHSGQVHAYSRPRAAKAALTRTLPQHIVERLRQFPDGVYDGELVAPSGKAWDVVVVGAQLVFVIFDVLALEGVSLTASPYHTRREALLSVLGAFSIQNLGQTAISTVVSLSPTWARVEAVWKRGGEGVILKRLDSHYRPGYRSPEWIKVKESHAATLTITGYEAGKSGPYSKLALRDGDGCDTTVKTLTNALLRDIAKSPAAFIGRRVVITYQEKTPGGTYRHGIFDHFAGAGE